MKLVAFVLPLGRSGKSLLPLLLLLSLPAVLAHKALNHPPALYRFRVLCLRLDINGCQPISIREIHRSARFTCEL